MIAIFSAFAVTAQQVVASSGITATAGGYTVDWTLDEPGIETFTGSNHILTQGIHQTNLVVGIGTPLTENFSAIAWSGHSHYLKVEMDPNNGNTFTHLGTSHRLLPMVLVACTQKKKSEQIIYFTTFCISIMCVFTQN